MRHPGNNTALPATIRWLAANAGFPSRRLPEPIERAVCLLHAATCLEPVADNPLAGRFERRQNAVEASQRALAENRRRVHFKCDNSAKV
jgi:hypothetical protein